MKGARFEGFSAKLFEFLRGLAEHNTKEWFDQHRHEYETEVLGPVKAFTSELGPILYMLNQEFETEPRVGRTVSRINNDIRFHKDRPRYRPFLYVSFPRRGHKWTSEALLYTGIYKHGVAVGFYPGGYKEKRIGPMQQAIRENLRLFQRYLNERGIADSYWELAGEEGETVTKWPLPRTARRWVNLESFSVGQYFPASDPALRSRAFLDLAQEIMLEDRKSVV